MFEATVPVDVKDKEQIVGNFELYQNYPNPFNPTTTIKFTVPYREDVRMVVYNTIGQKVAVLVDGALESGAHKVEFNGGNLSSVIYFYELSSGNFRSVNKMILLK